MNLEIFDSEGDRGSREDDGKDAGAANYVTNFAHKGLFINDVITGGGGGG